MSRILLKLPVPSYLKKILIVKYGEDYVAKQNHSLGLTILGALALKRDRNYDPKLKSKFTNEFHIWISLDRARHHGYEFQNKRAYQIARSIDRETRRELYITAITNKHNYEIDYQTTLVQFLETYDITTEELSYESLRKDFNRFLHNPKNKTLIDKICV